MKMSDFSLSVRASDLKKVESQVSADPGAVI